MLDVVGIVGGIAGFGTVIGLLVHLHQKQLAALKDQLEAVKIGHQRESVTEANRIITELKRFHEHQIEAQKRRYEAERDAREREFEAAVTALQADKEAVEAALAQIKDPSRVPVLKYVGQKGPGYVYVRPDQPSVRGKLQ